MESESSKDFISHSRKGSIDQTTNEKQRLLETEEKLQHRGLSLYTAALFIVAEICGGGALVLPMALTKTGLAGLIVMISVLIMDAYGGHLLGKSWWKIKENRTDDEPIRDPYPYIGELAAGKTMRYAVTIILGVYIFSVCIVYLLLASQTFSTFVSFHVGSNQHQTDIRIWLIIISSAIFPMMLLGTPKDNWIVAAASAILAALGLLLIWIKYILIYRSNNAPVYDHERRVTASSFLSAFGTYAFSMSGATLFPTVQTDMTKPKQITKAICLAYLGMAILYIPTAVGGYVTVRWIMKDSVLETLATYDKLYNENASLVTAANILFAIHFVGGFVLMINPVIQHLEEYFGVPYDFSPKRLLSRGAVLLVTLGIAELFPRFGPLLDLAGCSVNVFICFIFPVWFYLKLFSYQKVTELIIPVIVVVLAVIAGIMSTYTNVVNVINTLNDIYSISNRTIT